MYIEKVISKKTLKKKKKFLSRIHKAAFRKAKDEGGQNRDFIYPNVSIFIFLI
jgi:hypothetical protein